MCELAVEEEAEAFRACCAWLPLLQPEQNTYTSTLTSLTPDRTPHHEAGSSVPLYKYHPT